MNRHHFDRDQFAWDATLGAQPKSLSLAVPLPDREALRHQPFFFQIPPDSFADDDPNAVVKYHAHLVGGGALPEWLLFDPATGAFSGTPPHNAERGYDIVVRARDGNNSVRDVFHLSVPTHDAAPVAAAIEDQAVGEDTAWAFTLPAGTFSDADSKDLTFSAAMTDGNALPYWLHFDRLTQTFTGTPPQDFNGVLDIVVTADDGARSDTSVFQLTVTPAEDAPHVAGQTPDQWASEDTPLNFSLLPGTFVDPDGDALTYSATLANGDALPDWLTFDPATQTFSGTPPKDLNGVIPVKVIASDGVETGSEVFNLNVSAINDSPVVHRVIDDAHLVGGDAFTYTLPANTFTDVDNANLTYTATLANGDPLPDWLIFDSATQTFSGSAPLGFDEPIAVTVTASDGVASASDTFSFSDSTPFVVNAIPDQTVGDETGWRFRVPHGTFHDFDGPNLAYSATLANGDPLPDWLIFDSATRTFKGTPPEGWSGHEDIKLTASDGTHEASDTFGLDQTGDFRYQISGSTWGRNAPSEIHYLWNSAYLETSFGGGAGFDVGFSGLGVHGGLSGSVAFNATIQAGLLLEFTLKPDTFNMTESFDVHHAVSAFQINVDPTVQVTGEVEDTTKFHSTTPDDAFALHAFAGITATASLEVAGGVSAGIDGIGDVSAGFDHTFDLPSIPKITIADGKFTKPDGDVGAVEVDIHTGDPVYTLDLDSSGIGHIIIGPPSKTTIDTFDFIDPSTPNGGLQTLHAEAVSDPFLGANLDLDALAVKIVPELAPLFHAHLGVGIGIGSLSADLNSDISLVGDLSFGKAFLFTPEVDYTMKTSYGETLTGVAGDQQEFHTPEGEGTFKVKATYTTQAVMQTVLFLQGNIHIDYSLLQASVGASVGVGSFSVGGSYDFNPVYAGTQGLFTFAIPIFASSDRYTLDQSKTETFTVQYEKFRTADGSGHTFTFTTHQLTSSLSNDADTITGNALDNVIFGKGGDDTLNGLDGMDTLNGSLGNDHLFGGAGFNSLDGGDGDDILQSGDDGSIIDAGAGNDIIKTGLGDDTITDLFGAVNITDSGGNNTITLGDEGYTFKLLKGNNTLHTGLGNDNITMGAGNDHVFAGDGTNVIAVGEGDNSADGGAGNDTITAGSGNDHLDGKGGDDIINGGDGNNTIEDDGGTNHITTGSGDDHFQLGTGRYTVDAGDGANQFAIIGSTSSVLTAGSGNDSFDVRNGTNSITAGGGKDFVNGGIGNDTINGGLGADSMAGGEGKDTFVYSGVADSTGVNFDRIFDFDVKKDHIDLTGTVTGIDAGRSGNIAVATFDHDLKQILSATHLLAGHAAVVTAKGDLIGDIFLVIDANGVAGYQTGADYVIRVDGAASTHFVMGDFI